MFRVIIRTSIGFGMMFGKPDGRKLSIQSGFPPAYEIDSDELIRAFCGEHHFSIQVGSNAAKEFHMRVSREQIHLMAQPTGTLFSVSVGNDGVPLKEMRNLFKKNVIVFDAGFGTLDLFPIRNGRLEKSQTNQTLGMKRVMQETCKKLQKKNVNLTVPALQKYLESGFARYHTRIASKNVPFAEELEESSKQVCNEAVSWMTQMIPLYEYDYLIITGGTGAAWSADIREILKDMETLAIVDGNCNDTLPMVFANVRGYYLYRLSKLRRGDKS